MKEEKTYIIRKHLKLDQKAFASKLGLSQSAISQFENGTRVVSKELYKRIADVFKIDIDSAIEQFKSKNIEKQAAEEINEKVRIVKILAETTLSVDTNIYLQEIANIVIGDSKLLRAALSKFDYLKKRDMLKSNYVFRYDIEVKCDLAFPTIEEYHKYVDSMPDEEVEKILADNLFSFRVELKKIESIEYKYIFDSLSKEIAEKIDKDENLSLLLKHGVIRPSELLYDIKFVTEIL